jgi:hypothetical protein
MHVISISQVLFPLFKDHHQEIEQQASIIQVTLKDKLEKFISGQERKW